MRNVWSIANRRSMLATGLALFLSGNASGQQLDVTAMQKNIDIFSGVLAEALDLEQASGLFGISLGGIDNTYLVGQGVVLEVRTPLSSRRNTIGLASLSSTLRNMQTRENPFAALAQSSSAASPQSSSLAVTEIPSDADSFYRNMMDTIANVDFSLMVNSAIQQASEYARSLRSLEGVDDNTYQQLRRDIDELREEMQEGFARLRQIQSEVEASNVSSTDDANRSRQADLQASLDAVVAKLEPLRDKAIAKADELRELSRVAEQEYATDWRQQVENFETSLYAAMCDYGSTLHELPDEENVSVILTGLGEDTSTNRRADKVHVFSKQNLLLCQSGDIDQETLQQRSVEYSY